jgi:hypothetical protein
MTLKGHSGVGLIVVSLLTIIELIMHEFIVLLSVSQLFLESTNIPFRYLNLVLKVCNYLLIVIKKQLVALRSNRDSLEYLAQI